MKQPLQRKLKVTLPLHPKWLVVLAISSLMITAVVAQGSPGYVAREDGAWIHYLEAGKQAGSETSVLFVPGWTMPAWIWGQQLASLQGEYRVVAMSPRSQGRSSKETDGHYPAARAGDIKLVIDQLALKRVLLVAWSLGVSEAVAFVDRYGSDNLAGLVLVDGLAGQDAAVAMSSESISEMAALQSDREAATRSFVTSMFRTRRSPEYLNRLTQAALDTPANSALALLLGAFTFDLRDSLSNIDVPTLIAVAGNEQNPYMPEYRAMQEAIPGARLEIFPEAGHALFVDESARFNQLLRQFLGQIVSPGG